ncbi:MAG TPA: class I SAM-dependent methyltransferase [Chlamydiales bacterium]|nr:class I SAM-dependent methyltransferase [Chlamydiales bacterium]
MHWDVQSLSHYEYFVDVDRDVAILKLRTFEIMKHLEGWCSEKKASILLDYILRIKPDRVVEIGVFGGKSLIPIALCLKENGKGKIYGIDPWDNLASIHGMLDEANKTWWNQIDHQKIKWGLIDKIWQLGLNDQVELWQTTSADSSSIPDIDILHIDGNHSAEMSYEDVIKWVPLVKKDGLIIFNDMNWTENGIITTKSAIEWLNSICHRLAEFTDEGEEWGIWVKK